MDQSPPPQMPGTYDFGLPPQFRDHPLLSAAPYFTLPGKLFQQLLDDVGEKRFDADLLEMEDLLSDMCGDHSSRIGFWRGQPINFLLLRPKNNLTDDFFVQGMSAWGKNSEQARLILAVGQERLDWTVDVRRGYCGWLMTNRAFLDEQRQLFHSWASKVAQQGIPRMGTVLRNAPSLPKVELAEGEMPAFIQAFEDFFIRWRLEGMPAPWAPQPMGPHLPVADLRPVFGHMRQAGTTFYIPDIYPVPSRDALREIIEEALRACKPPAHLAEWFEIVRSDNTAKNQIPRYARVFELQHYLRALYARHAAALKRTKSAIIRVFSMYLGVSDDTVARDLNFIAARLGPDWYLAPH